MATDVQAGSRAAARRGSIWRGSRPLGRWLLTGAVLALVRAS